jgi:hypothetical protein
LKKLNFLPKKVFITVKAYPSPSVNYGETVCCAGVEIATNQWIRLYPIPFRDLKYNQQFKKYSLIEANCAKATDDLRPESYRIQSASIKIIEHIDTRKGGWEKRKAIVKRLPLKSLCQVLRERESINTSLGLIKPEDISFSYKKRTEKDPQKIGAAYSQPTIFDRSKAPIEVVPFQFYYRFRCTSEPNCAGHNLSIVDWEIYQLYRNLRNKSSCEKELLSKIEQKWMEIVDSTKKDVFFYVGNLHRFQEVFTVLGVFYPPRNLT